MATRYRQGVQCLHVFPFRPRSVQTSSCDQGALAHVDRAEMITMRSHNDLRFRRTFGSSYFVLKAYGRQASRWFFLSRLRGQPYPVGSSTTISRGSDGYRKLCCGTRSTGCLLESCHWFRLRGVVWCTDIPLCRQQQWKGSEDPTLPQAVISGGNECSRDRGLNT